MKYIFGAAFDPITRAHVAIMKAIAKHMTNEDTLYVLVSNDDEKNYKLEEANREILVKETLVKEVFHEYPINYEIMEQPTRMWRFLTDKFENLNDITIVVGEDEWKSLTNYQWKNSIDLLATFKFIVVGRENTSIDFDKFDAKLININMPNCSSTMVRDVFYMNPDTKYKEVNQYIALETFKQIKEHSYYCQNGDKYYDNEDDEIKAYKKKAEENHWGVVSATTDTVIYNGTKVLLIRRKKWPYRYFWALPGGFFEPKDADLNYGAAREVMEETTLNLDPKSFEMINVYGHNFDPRMKIVDTAFSVRVHKKDMYKVRGADDAIEAKWFDINDLPAMAFHHEQIIKDYMKTNIIEVCNENTKFNG